MRYKNGECLITKRTDKICLVCKKVYSATPRQKFCSDCWGKQRNYRDKLELAEKVNHKVVSVGFYGYGDTYNLEVDTYHNFPANGIMVHNCHESLQYIAVQIFQPIQRIVNKQREEVPKSRDNI
jgi:hypothetical protein